MATERIHTYCAMCVSRCGVVATVEDGRFNKVLVERGSYASANANREHSDSVGFPRLKE